MSIYVNTKFTFQHLTFQSCSPNSITFSCTLDFNPSISLHFKLHVYIHCTFKFLHFKFLAIYLFFLSNAIYLSMHSLQLIYMPFFNPLSISLVLLHCSFSPYFDKVLENICEVNSRQICAFIE